VTASYFCADSMTASNFSVHNYDISFGDDVLLAPSFANDDIPFVFNSMSTPFFIYVPWTFRNNIIFFFTGKSPASMLLANKSLVGPFLQPLLHLDSSSVILRKRRSLGLR
jgi:hypothetical protein